MSHLAPKVPAEQMTWRARAYLVVAAVRHLLIALSTVVLADAFTADGWRVIRQVFGDTTTSMTIWGAIFTFVGCSFVYAAWKGSEPAAWFSLILSVIAMTVWGVGFFEAWREGGQTTPVGAILCGTVAATDLIMCRYPLRDPFDPIVQEYVRETDG